MDEIEATLIWLRAPGTGAVRLRRVLARFGSFRAALEAGPRAWLDCGIVDASSSWLRAPDRARLRADLAWLNVDAHHFLRFDHPDFPPLLQPLDDAPVALFVVGDPIQLWHAQIAIVGSRSASPSGLLLARDFAQTLARAGFVITSGMADGIDAKAHNAALDVGACSVAVLGTGVDVIYPRKHQSLATRLATAGALVSEFPLQTGPAASHFPRRNRIISGLCLGTLVIEAGLRSGSLITARLAAEQGREVFAVPGSVHNPLARGCHRLIREGAKLVETAEDVIEELGPLAAKLALRLHGRIEQIHDDRPAEHITQASQQCDQLLQAMGHDPVDVDTLIDRCSLTAATISSMLTTLELDGVVATLGGNSYQRIRFNANADPSSARKTR